MNQYSVYILTYHLVLVIKYRIKGMKIFLIHWWLFLRILVLNRVLLFKKRSGWLIIFHIFEAKLSTDLVKFINSYKSASSRIIKKQFPVIKKEFMEKYI